jgi:hypothetical protein
MNFNPRDMARNALMSAETGAATSLLESLLRRHQQSWQKYAPRLREYDDPPDFEPQPRFWCSECTKSAPCDVFILGSTLLGMVELLDGSRFSKGWRGPVEDRRY